MAAHRYISRSVPSRTVIEHPRAPQRCRCMLEPMPHGSLQRTERCHQIGTVRLGWAASFSQPYGCVRVRGQLPGGRKKYLGADDARGSTPVSGGVVPRGVKAPVGYGFTPQFCGFCQDCQFSSELPAPSPTLVCTPPAPPSARGPCLPVSTIFLSNDSGQRSSPPPATP